jgi:hypothetical protein
LSAFERAQISAVAANAGGVVKSASQAAVEQRVYFRRYIPKSQFVFSHMQKAFFKVLRFAAHWAFGRAELNLGHAHPALTEATAPGMRGGLARTDGLF